MSTSTQPFARRLVPLSSPVFPTGASMRAVLSYTKAGAVALQSQRVQKDCVYTDLPQPPMTQVLGDTGACLVHNGYLEYLDVCYNCHLIPKVWPDLIWQGLLCEVAALVRGNPEAFRAVFTTSAGMTDITVPGNAESEPLPVGLVTSALQAGMPNLAAFLPEFSTTDDASCFAFQAALCEAASPYYSYVMYLCGFPSVDVHGTQEDWALLRDYWVDLHLMVFGALPNGHAIHSWATRVEILLAELADQTTRVSSAFWDNWYNTEPCGSGHERVVLEQQSVARPRRRPGQTCTHARVTDLWFVQPELRKPCNFNPHVAVVPYRQVESGRKYSLRNGALAAGVDVASGLTTPGFYSVASRVTP